MSSLVAARASALRAMCCIPLAHPCLSATFLFPSCNNNKLLKVTCTPAHHSPANLSFSLGFTRGAAPRSDTPLGNLNLAEVEEEEEEEKEALDELELQEEDDDDDEEEHDQEQGYGDNIQNAGVDREEDFTSLLPEGYVKPRPFPPLSSRERRELRGYVHELGKKVTYQQVGKSGVTVALAKAVSDLLEAREVLKLRILDNCPEEVEVVSKKIEVSTQAQVVGKVGRVIVLYRPSLRKLAAAQNKKNVHVRSQVNRTREATSNRKRF